MKNAVGVLMLIAGLIGSVTTSGNTKLGNTGELVPLSIDEAASIRKYFSHALSPDGSWIASVFEDRSTNRKALRVREIEGKYAEDLSSGDFDTASPVWSPDGSKLAFISDRSGTHSLWIWTRATRESRPYTAVNPPSIRSRIAWLADSKRLVIQVVPEGQVAAPEPGSRRPEVEFERRYKLFFPKAVEGKPSVVVEHAGPAKSFSSTGMLLEVLLEFPCAHALGKCDLAIVTVSDGTVSRIVKKESFSWFAPSPDGNALAYTRYAARRPEESFHRFDLHRVDIGTGAQYSLAKDLPLQYGSTISWSPEGEALAYSEQLSTSDGNLVIIDSSSGLIRGKRSGFNSDVIHAPLWSKDSGTVYVMSAAEELWSIEVTTGSATVFKSSRYSISGLILAKNSIVDGQRLVVSVASKTNPAISGLLYINLREMKSHLIFKTNQYISACGEMSRDGSLITYCTEASDQPRRLMGFNLASGKSRSLESESTGGHATLGKAHVIRYRDIQGRSLAASVLLPPGYDGARRLPTVIWAYGGAKGSEFVNRFYSTPIFNFQILATRGYAVIYPDVPIKVGRALLDIVEAVNAAADAIVARGIADPDRMAVMGHSFGSYSVLSVITQTERFKAAEITAISLPELTAQYLNGPSSVENGQVRMGVPPWNDRQSYFDNSPFWSFTRITTPLLMGQGELDNFPSITKSSFRMLQRLGKTAEFRLYEGEGHVIQRKVNVLDFWARRLAFLAEHLDLVVDRNGAVAFDGEWPRSHKRVSTANGDAAL